MPVCHYSVILFISYAYLCHTRYGSVSQYLVSAGFTEEEQEKLRAVFIHPKEEEDVEEMKEEEDWVTIIYVWILINRLCEYG